MSYRSGVTDRERPLRRDAERNRQLILTTAWTLIGERGLGVTHHDIAAAAGVGVGTIYRRFPTQQALVAALFEVHVDAVVALSRAARDAEDAWDGLQRFIEQTLEAQAQNRGLSELLQGATKDSTLTRRARARITANVGALVARAQADGQLPPDVTPGDLVLIEIMAAGVMSAARPFAPDLWRRALALGLEGLQAHSRLPGQPPSDDVMDRLWGVDEAAPQPDPAKGRR